MIPMYRLWLHGLYGLYGPRCPLSPERPLNLIRSGLTLDLRMYVHLGRACRFTYAVRWSGIPRKSRHGLTYADLTGQCHSQFEMDRIIICGIFKTIRVIQGQHGHPQSRFKTNESTVLASKWRAFLHFTWKCTQLATRLKVVSIGNMLVCFSFSL